MDTYKRIKYRPNIVQPELNVRIENQSLSLYKKIKPKEPKKEPKPALPPYRPPPMDPSLTQKRSVVTVISSEESKFRSMESPDVFERVKLHKVWLKKQEKDLKRQKNKKLLMQQWSNDIKNTLNIMDKAAGIDNYKPRQLNTVDDDYDDNKNSEKSLYEQDSDIDSDNDEDMRYKSTKRYAFALKERTIIRARTSIIYHFKYSFANQVLVCTLVSLGIGKLDYNLSKILPWLLIAKVQIVKDQTLLMKLSISHIMNITKDVENYLPKLFAYKKIPVDDVEEEDISRYFDEACEFIHHVETLKGRVRL